MFEFVVPIWAIGNRRLTELSMLALCLLTALVSLSAKAAGAPEHIQANDNRSTAGQLSRQQFHIELEAREGLWFPESHDGPGVAVQAFAERGKQLLIPGPMIRVPEGTRIRATVRNTLSMTLALHGFHTHPVDSPAPIQIAPGETRALDFHAGEPGTYFYWGSTMQGGPVTKLPIYRDGPLSGAFIVDSRGEPADPTERVFVISQWRENPALDPPNVLASHPAQRRTFAINGYAWPYTERLTYDLNRSVRWRWINATFEWHPLHLHGFYYDILNLGDAKRDVPFPPKQRPRVVTHRFDPGATMSMSWTPDRIGNWLFHCHILDHIDPTVRLRPNSAHASHSGNHATEAMSGLVMGITVREPTGYAHVPPLTARRKLKLLVQEQPRRFGDKSALGYALAKADGESAGDAVDIPGPLLVLTRNEPTSIEVVNRTREETSVHWHGMELESFYDGVPGWGGDSTRTTPPIRPGESFVAQMTPPRAGTFMYHTHWHDVRQLSSGMYGPLIVLEPGETYDPETERMILLSAGPSDKRFAEPLLINGSEKPVPMQMRAGATYRLRLINITADNANFNVTLRKNGELVRWRAVAKDGAQLPAAQRIESNAEQILTVGETRDYEVRPSVPGDMTFEIRNIAGVVRGVLNVEVQ